MKGEILTLTEINKIKAIALELIDETAKLTQEIKNLESAEKSSEKIATATNILDKQIRILGNLSKIEYKQDPINQEDSTSLSRLQVMARTLALSGLTILCPKNPTENEYLIYKTVEYINPIVNGRAYHIPTPEEVFGAIFDENSDENSPQEVENFEIFRKESTTRQEKQQKLWETSS